MAGGGRILISGVIVVFLLTSFTLAQSVPGNDSNQNGNPGQNSVAGVCSVLMTPETPRRPTPRSWLAAPFLWLDWSIKWVVYGLSRLAVFQLLEYAGRTTVVVALIAFLLEAPARKRQSHYQAWQVINLAQGQGAAAGRIEALRALNSDGQSLGGVNLNGAILSGINLRGADLNNADLRLALLGGANFEGANLFHAQLAGAYLANANLRRTNLRDADLSHANVKGADLRGSNLTLDQLQTTINDDATKHDPVVPSQE